MGLVRGTKEQSDENFFLKTAFYPVKVFIKFSPQFTSFH